MARGRPLKMTPERARAVLDGLRLGLSRTIAANAVGISKSTIANWAARSEAFRMQLEQAEAEAERMLIGLDLSLDVRQAAEESAAELGIDPEVLMAAMEEELRKRLGDGST